MQRTPVLATLFLIVLLGPTHGATFVDVSKDAGLDNLGGGGSAAWTDYDADGHVDLYAGGILFHNDAGEGFTDVTEAAGLPAGTRGATWGDCDKDGDPDLFLWKGTGRLFLNDGDGSFTDASSGLPELPMPVSRGATWADVNGDGLLDLYVGGYERWQKAIYPDALLLNEDGKTFRLAWQQRGKNIRSGRGVTACDFDEDGDTDIYVSNYRLQPNILWRNDDGTLVDVAAEYGAAGNPKQKINYTGGIRYGVAGHTIGSAWGDLDNDGHVDLFVGNFSHPPAYQDRPQFLRNQGPPDYHFEDVSDRAGLAWQESYASPALADYDNDGDLDLFLSTIYGGDHGVLYRNNGAWKFTDVTSEAGIRSDRTYQAAWGDYDGDGNMDLLTDGRLYENRTTGGHWVTVKLRGAATVPGTVVRLEAGDLTLTRRSMGATFEGNQNDPAVHCGT